MISGSSQGSQNMLSHWKKFIFPFLLIFLIGNFILIGSVARKNAKKESILPVLGQVMPFSMTDQDGQEMTLAGLDGVTWIADFIFTSCAGACPIMSSKMSELQAVFADNPKIKLVSFSVDPDTDTPAVLLEYGKRYRANPGKWTFLTGEMSVISRLAANDFHLGAVDEPIFHSTYFTIVDASGTIRGYYDSADDAAMATLVKDAHSLSGVK